MRRGENRRDFGREVVHYKTRTVSENNSHKHKHKHTHIETARVATGLSGARLARRTARVVGAVGKAVPKPAQHHDHVVLAGSGKVAAEHS